MKEIKIETTLYMYESIDELPRDINSLMQKAIEARKQAYAPYSGFHVGAALLLDNGVVVTGNNQENASYPSGLCAERTAIYYAGSKYPQAKILQLAISAGGENNPTHEPVPPCGACRQSIAEYEIKQKTSIEIYFMGTSGTVARSNSIQNLLPFIFDKSVL